MTIEDLVTTAQDAERADFDWGHILWLDGAEYTDSNALTVGKVTIHAGHGNPEHRHPNCDEALYLLTGRLRHTIGDEETVLEPGDLLHIPAGEPHAAESVGTDDAVAIITYDTGERGFEVVDGE